MTSKQTKSSSRIMKPTIFVTSTLRSGTLFFATLLDNIITQADVFHEPDMVTSPYWKNFREAATRFGVFPILVNKFRKKGNCRLLTIALAQGAISQTEAAEALIKMRQSFIMSLPGKVYGEANMQLAGLIDILPQAFPNSKIIFIIRDPREWIKSCHNHHWIGGVYGPFDYAYRLGGRLNARMLPDDPWYTRWSSMSQFERECWLWQKIYTDGIQTVEKISTARLWRFEDIFYADNRYQILEELLDFATEFPDGTVASYQAPDSLLEQKIHASVKSQFLSWPDWPVFWAKQMDAICGELMQQFGYGQEPEWVRMCRQ